MAAMAIFFTAPTTTATMANYVCRPRSSTLLYGHPVSSTVIEIVIDVAAGKRGVTSEKFGLQRHASLDGRKYHFNASNNFATGRIFCASRNFCTSRHFSASSKICASRNFCASSKFCASRNFCASSNFFGSQEFLCQQQILC